MTGKFRGLNVKFEVHEHPKPSFGVCAIMMLTLQKRLYVYQGIEMELAFGQWTDFRSPMGRFTVRVDGGDLAVGAIENLAAAPIETS